MKKNVLKVLNDQVNAEFFASKLYLSMSSYFSSVGLNGFSTWMRLQYEEECEHALKIYDYILSRGETVELEAIEKPQIKWKGVLEAVEDALEHEKKVTSMIYNIVDVATKEKDYATVNLMNWYVNEQVEEEDSVSYLIDQLQLAGDNKASLLLIDRELGNRVSEE